MNKFWKSHAGSIPAAAPGQRDAAGSRTGVLTVPHPAGLTVPERYTSPGQGSLGSGLTRRRFLAGLIALPAVKYFLPPVGGWPVGFSTADMRFKYTERFSTGFTNWRGIYGTSGDGVALASAAHPFPTEAFRAALLPGLQKIWAAEYDKHGDEFTAIYGEEPPSLLNPESLEEIEIGYDEASNAVGPPSGLLEAQRVATADALGKFQSNRERNGSLLLPRLLGLRKTTS